ncbi:MAG: hypothetical protein ACREAE_05720 [Nitrosopumilaceae archaeon]
MDYDYIKSLLEQTIDSYKILNELRDKSGDLDTIKKELGKIQGLVQVLVNKIEKSENYSDSYSELLDASKLYLKDYSFHSEIDRISQLYSEDHHRIKNIRLSILAALEKTKLITKAIALLEVL